MTIRAEVSLVRPASRTQSHWMSGQRLWGYVVTADGVVVAADNCTSYAKMQAQARRDVEVFRRMRQLGYKLQPWSQLVEEAMSQ